MPTVTKTWAFATDAEGLTDQGNNAQITFSWQTGDGDPAGCVKFAASPTLTDMEGLEDALASTGETWEDWGVPAGMIVTHVQLTAWRERTAAITNITEHDLQIGAVTDTSTGSLPHHIAGRITGGSLITDWLLNEHYGSPSVDGSWQAGTVGDLLTVRPTHQASNTGVRLQLAMYALASSETVNYDQRLDQIAVTMTYTDPPSPRGIPTMSGRRLA